METFERIAYLSSVYGKKYESEISYVSISYPRIIK